MPWKLVGMRDGVTRRATRNGVLLTSLRHAITCQRTEHPTGKGPMARRPPLPPLVVLLLAACAPVAPPATAPGVAAPPASARELVERVRARWAEAPTALVMRQLNTTYTSAGESSSEWLRRQRAPGLLRLDFVRPAATGGGVLHRGDSVYVFDAGRPVREAEQANALLRLGADVPARPADSTLAALVALGVDTARFRADRWNERAAWVVGAAEGDSAAPQLWVDAERLAPVRLVLAQRLPSGRTIVTDHRLSYAAGEGAPVPAEIVFLRGGRPYLRERYADVRADSTLEDALFRPADWAHGVPVP